MPAPADELPVNAFKRGLQAGKPRIGLRRSRFHSVAVEIVAGSGFDWLLPDTGHAPNDPFMVLSQLQAAEGGAAIPIVRMPWDAAVMIKRCLDMGVQASLVPFVQNAEEARALVATRFPQFSNGARGFTSGSRASRYGRVPNYHQRAHEEMRLLTQAETRTALKEIEAIAAVPGIDGIFTGPGGGVRYGCLGPQSHPEALQTIAGAIQRTVATGKAPGILAPAGAETRRWLEPDATFVAVGGDAGCWRGAARRWRPSKKLPE